MSRPRPLAVALLAFASAAIFLLLRVLYRVVFGGAGGSGEALFEIPRYQLWGVFSHILVGGEVTLDGLVSSVTSGLPFATAIVASGVLLAWWDPRRLVLSVPRLRFGRTLVLATAIALSTLPVLVGVIRDTRRAAARRRVRGGRRIILPVLEKTLENAVGIHAALIARGIVTPLAGKTPAGRSAVELRDVSWPERGLRDVSVECEPGSLTILTGHTGSGKTSLLELIAGLHPNLVSGLGGGDRIPSSHTAFLPHQPRRLFLASMVRDEVALSLVMGGMARARAREHATEVLSQWKLEHLSECHPSELSAGEATRLGLVVLIATSPSVLVLDEPLHTLDSRSRHEMLERLDELTRTGLTIIMSDHRSTELDGYGASFFTLTPGGLRPGRYRPPPSEAALLIPRPSPDPDVVARFEDVNASFAERSLFRGLDVEMRRGRVTLINGDNGVGKTTLLELIADSDQAAGTVAYVPHEPTDLFFTDSVEAELALADRSSRVAPGLTRMTLEAILSGAWRRDLLENVGDTHPRDLSRGQQMALAIAIQMSHRPTVLALDEPTAGLDESAVNALIAVLGCAVETGIALLIATQEPEAFASLEGSRLRLHGGELRELRGVQS
jgi:energy-coupling factor transporter ATP-binding protein EcfA2